MRKAISAVLMAATVLPMASVVLAQESARLPPAGHPTVRIYEFGAKLPDGAPIPLRRAKADGDIRQWISESDPEIGMVLADPSLDATAMVYFDIDASGRAVGCTVKPDEGDEQVTADLCERLRDRVRMIPALSPAGERVPDIALISVRYSSERRSGGLRIENLSPTLLIQAYRWPTPYRSGDGKVTELDVLPGGGGSPAALGQPWAGVQLLNNAEGQLICRQVGSSGDADFNARACEASGQGLYDFSGIAEPGRRKVDVLFVQHEGRPRAIVASQEESRAWITPPSLTALRQALAESGLSDLGGLKVAVVVGVHGEMVRCVINATSGTDAGDLAVCALLREHGRYGVARDIFGRPMEKLLTVPVAQTAP